MKECRKIEGEYVDKIVSGRINVYLKTQPTFLYYVQEGEKNEPVVLRPEAGRGEIYEMLVDHEPAKRIMDEYVKKNKLISIQKVVEAINVYNNR